MFHAWVSYLSDFGVRNFEIQVAPSVDGSGNLVDAVTCTIYEAYVNQGAPTTFECDMPRSGSADEVERTKQPCFV